MGKENCSGSGVQKEIKTRRPNSVWKTRQVDRQGSLSCLYLLQGLGISLSTIYFASKYSLLNCLLKGIFSVFCILNLSKLFDKRTCETVDEIKLNLCGMWEGV